jgi:hypothetical protein
MAGLLSSLQWWPQYVQLALWQHHDHQIIYSSGDEEC